MISAIRNISVLTASDMEARSNYFIKDIFFIVKCEISKPQKQIHDASNSKKSIKLKIGVINAREI